MGLNSLTGEINILFRRKELIPTNSPQQLKKEVEIELLKRILPFWMEKTIDKEKGGFYGTLSNDLTIDLNSPKGCILNSRILWTFSAAYRKLKDRRYLDVADRAYDYLINHFWDRQWGGLFFMVDSQGKANDLQKLVYNLAFGIYGLAEYYRATQTEQSLGKALELYGLIEKNCYDSLHQGYFEGCSRKWVLSETMQLSPRDLVAEKSMNTHLHLLEAYTGLFRVWDHPHLKEKLRELIQVFIGHIINPETHHFRLFFDADWKGKNPIISMGHDIEGSWLLYEGAEVLGDPEILAVVRNISIAMARRVYDEGMDRGYGGLYNEVENGVPINTVKIWWPQCEAMVGFFNAYRLTGKQDFLEAVYQIWDFTAHHLLDYQHGEWFGETSREGDPNQDYYKVGPWKCPYHNGRMCLELMERIGEL